MSKVRGDGPRGGRRTFTGTRVDEYLKRKGENHKWLAAGLGVEQKYLNDMLAGRKALSGKTLKDIAETLGNCTVEDLLGKTLEMAWYRVERQFLDDLSKATDQPWYFFHDPRWGETLSTGCFVSACQLFQSFLKQLWGLKVAADIAGIAPLVSRSIDYVERAYCTDVSAKQILFELCEWSAHSRIALVEPEALMDASGDYIRTMLKIVKDRQGERLLLIRLLASAGELLRCSNPDDKRTLFEVDTFLRLCLKENLVKALSSKVMRDRLIIGAKIARTESEFSQLLEAAERLLQSSNTLEERLYLIHGQANASATRARLSGGRAYRKNALKCYERASDLAISGSPTEISLRVRELPIMFATSGITDLIGNAKSLFAELQDLSRLTGSVRFARQLDISFASLKKKKIISD